jgi:hypothetical protein
VQSPLSVDTQSSISHALDGLGETLSCSSRVTVVRVRPRMDSSITSFRSSITAFDCSGVKPCASSRWTTLRVSKLVDRQGRDVLKLLTAREGINGVIGDE